MGLEDVADTGADRGHRLHQRLVHALRVVVPGDRPHAPEEIGHLGRRIVEELRDDVGVLRVIIVSRSVEIGRHHRQIVRAVLPVVAPTHFDAGDFGQGIGPVGGLQ